MLERYLGPDRSRSLEWESLSHGAPTIIGLAQIAAQAMSHPLRDPDRLSTAARCLLHLARHRGTLDVRGSNDTFERADRLLMVHVDLEDDRTVVLRTPGNARGTIRFLEGLRELCEAGLVLHHLQGEFTLSTRGFEVAEQVSADGLDDLLAAAHPVT